MPAGALRYGVPAGLTAALALGLYLRTLLPDVGTWDTAEFQAIGPVLGIAHPTGYPTYTLFAWLGSVILQPFGTEAYRANLLSALLVAGAGGLLAVAAVQLTGRVSLGLLAGIAFVVTPIAWQLGLRADAHALHAFLAALLLVLLLEWRRREAVPPAPGAPASAGHWLIIAAGVFGLSLGNHALTLLLAPGIAAFVLLVSPGLLWRRWRLTLACLVTTLGVTALVYAYLPLRSLTEPPMDYARPRTWDRFWYLVLGAQFRGSFRSLPALDEALGSAWGSVTASIGTMPAVIALGGIAAGLRRHAPVVALTLLWAAGTWLFALGYANAAIERYHLVPLLVACLWLALGVEALGRLAATVLATRLGSLSWSGAGAVGALAALLVAILLVPVPERLGRLDLSRETFGRRWLEATLAAVERDAVIVSWWSYSTTLWYGRWVEGRRSDILIIDDRDVLDEGYGTAAGAIDRFLGERPVYLIRLEPELRSLAERYELEAVPGMPAPGQLFRVVARRTDA